MHNTGMSKRDRLERAGEWLRKAREQAGYKSAGEFARELGVDPSAVSRYERGVSEIDDERAEKIAKTLYIGVLEVRRRFGLWVPDESAATESEPEEPTAADLARQIAELADQLAQLGPRDAESDRQRKLG